MRRQGEEEGVFDWTKLGIQTAAVWIAVGLGLSFLRRVDLFALGDFNYATAMYYHGLMVPLLVMFYLLTIAIWPLKMLRRRIYGVGSIIAILLAGPASMINSSEGLSIADLLQIGGMVITDVLGLVLLVTLWRVATKDPGEEQRKPGAAVWLLLSSVAAVTLAAPIGHLAGWGIDFGIRSFPGVAPLVKATGMQPLDFQEGLISSHSHLIVSAIVSGLIALAAKLFRYERVLGWRKHVIRLVIWLMLISIWTATAIYMLSALTGWEPFTLFVSGPNGENGIPLDDVVLSVSQFASLPLIAVLIVGSVQNNGGRRFGTEGFIRAVVFLNCLCSFIGVVVLGLYIEFNETFYGGGEPPALGAANDQAFIRGHLLYPFLLLPIVLVFLIAVSSRRNRATMARTLSLVFASVSVLGMGLGLAGEFLWVLALNESMLLYATLVIFVAIIAGAASLLTSHSLILLRLRTSN